MNKKQIGLLFIVLLTWIQVGVWVTNWLFPGYSITPLNNNHLLFFSAWLSTPILIFVLIQIRQIATTQEEK